MVVIARHLYLLRHAKSSWEDPGVADHDRPLNPRGRQAAERLAEHFRKESIRPQLVLCSSAVRAVQTLAPISAAVGLADRTEVDPGLYVAAARDLLDRLRELDERVSSVLLVAHNPGLQHLALVLAGDDPAVVARLSEKFPTGALADVVFESNGWSDLAPGLSRVASLTFPRDLTG